MQFKLYPPTCVLCNTSGHSDLDICPACVDSLARINSPCPSCGMPLEASEHSHCGSCLQLPPPFQSTHSPFYYEPPLVKLVTDFKFNNQLKMARVFAGLLRKTLADRDKPDCIIPVPLHRRRLQERGYNQSLEIARLLGKTLGIPVDYRLCQRTRHTPPQTGLDAKQRRRNMKNAFGLTAKCHYRHVAILDDVITTGNTVSELAGLLRKNGVEKVEVWSVARAVPD
ncbi:MAG: ComF family protein [Gammaproteobacteria bacterium]|nr:ComF family protein [Gammaproteobacteria bacterium]